MGNDDLIAGLHQAVKQDIIERYLRERRIIEEESFLLEEAVAAYQGGLSFWDKSKELLFSALISVEDALEFAHLARLGPPLLKPGSMKAGFARPKALGRKRAYQALIKGLYQELWDRRHNLLAERRRMEQLFEEVNRDIKRFESGHDMMLLHSYLRSLDPKELTRRKVLGVNFSAQECSLAAESLCFKLYDRQALQIDLMPEEPLPPEEVMPLCGRLLKRVYQKHPRLVESLWTS